MTTLIGIKAERGLGGVILASDLSRTQTTWSAQGDIAYRQQTKQEGQKIYVDKKREVALCMSGVFDQYYIDFLSEFLNGNINIKKATQKGYFPQFKALNEIRWEGEVPNKEYANSLLIATRFDKPRLYSCYPLGKVVERAWTTIGSGSNYAGEYISKQGKLIPKGLSLDEGIRLTISSLDEASQDIYTGGLDLAVITKNKIQEFGKDIKIAMDSAKSKIVDKIQKEVTKR